MPRLSIYIRCSDRCLRLIQNSNQELLCWLHLSLIFDFVRLMEWSTCFIRQERQPVLGILQVPFHIFIGCYLMMCMVTGQLLLGMMAQKWIWQLEHAIDQLTLPQSCVWSVAPGAFSNVGKFGKLANNANSDTLNHWSYDAIPSCAGCFSECWPGGTESLRSLLCSVSLTSGKLLAGDALCV